MKRPLFVVGTTLLFSVAVSFLFTPKQGFLLSAAFLITALLITIIKKSKFNAVAVVLVSIALGFAVSSAYRYIKLTPFENLSGQKAVTEGFVKEAKRSSERSTRYIISATFPNTDLPDTDIVIRDYIQSEIRAGERIRAKIEFRAPKYQNTADYYLKNAISAEAVLLEMPEILELQKSDTIPKNIMDIREWIAKKNNSLYKNENAALINAMVFGMTDDIPSDLYSVLNRSGTSHLISVSGLHLSIFTAFVLILLGKTFIPKKLQWFIAIIANILFTALVGFSPPIIRSCIMSVMFLFGNMIGRKNDSINSLGFSAVIICAVAPYWALSLGMWLSYFATAGILFIGTEFSNFLFNRFKRSGGIYNRVVKAFTTGFGITAGAYVFTVPILVFEHGWVSIISPLANILVSPFSGIIVVGGILAVILPESIIFYPLLTRLVEFSSKMIISISEITAGIPFSTISVDSLPVLLAFVLVGVIAVLAFINRRKAGALMLAVLISFGVLSVGEIIKVVGVSNKIQFVTLEGNTSSMLIRNKSAVIIGAPDTYELDEIIRYLDYRSITEVDILIAPDMNYPVNTGLKRLVERYNLKSIIGPDDAIVLEEMARLAKGVPVYSCRSAEVSFLGGATASFSDDEGIIDIRIGSHFLSIYNEKCDIIDSIDNKDMWISDITKKQINPLGKSIYRENEIIIPV